MTDLATPWLLASPIIQAAAEEPPSAGDFVDLRNTQDLMPSHCVGCYLENIPASEIERLDKESVNGANWIHKGCSYHCSGCGYVESIENMRCPCGIGYDCCEEHSKCSTCTRIVHEDDLCSNCDSESSCCTCNQCPRCSGDEDYCECFYCDSCDGKYSGDDQCEDCCYCQSCCICNRCGKCREIVDLCGDCGRCLPNGDASGCCRCSKVEPGWRVRGHKFSKLDPDKAWTELLAEALVHEVDPVQSMCDFYLLDFIAAHGHGSSILSVFADEALAIQANMVAKLDTAFRVYADMAIGGELRHHSRLSEMRCDREEAWARWKIIRDEVGPQALLDAAELFMDINRSGYGGEPWANAAKVLHLRETNQIDPKTFVDRVFSLQHNGGSLLNKIPSNPANLRSPGTYWLVSNRPKWMVEVMTAIGQAHAAAEPELTVLLTGATRKVASLFAEWWRARNAERIQNHESPLVQPRAIPFPHSEDPYDGYKTYYFGDGAISVPPVQFALHEPYLSFEEEAA